MNHELGVRENILNLYKSYQSDRQQFIEIDDTLFEMEYIKCGIPQQCLSPSSFSNIYH